MQSELPPFESRRARLTRLRSEESLAPSLEAAPNRAELHALYAENVERIRRGTAGGASKARFCNAELSEDAFEELADCLENREGASYRAIAAVAWILGQARLSEGRKNRVGAALRKIVLERNSGVVAKAMRRTRFVFAQGATVAALGCLAAFALNFAPRFAFAPLLQRAMYVGFPCAGALIAVVRRRVFETRRRDAIVSALRVLHKFAQPESLLCFCDSTADPDFAKLAEKALLSTLPLVVPERRERLEPNLVKELCDLMLDCSASRPALVMAIAEALAKIGSTEAIRPLQKVLAQSERGDFSQSEPLKATLERALLVVRERAEREEATRREEDDPSPLLPEFES